MTDYLPPVVLRLAADIDEYLAKLAEADVALQVFTRGAADHLGAATPAFGEEGERAARAFTERLRDERGRFVRAGEDSADDYHRGFSKSLSRLSDWLANALKNLPGTLGSIGSGAGTAFTRGFVYTAIPALVGAAAQLIAGLAPAVGALALIPAAALSAATALGTLKLALSGVGAAVSAGMSGDMVKFDQALQGLAPSAQAAVRAIVALKPQLDAIKQTVQGNFFAGLAGDIKALGGQYLPILRTELGATATGFNEVIGSITQMARAPASVAAFAATMHNVMLAVTGVADALPGVLSGFATLARVGSTFLPGLTGGFAALADRFAAFMNRVAQSGQLAEFIRNGLTAVRELNVLLGNLWSIVSSVFTAMGAAGGQVLGVLGQLVGVLAAFFKSASGAAALTSLFTMLGQIANALGAGLGQVLVALGPLLNALLTGLEPIITLLTGQFLPVVAQLASTLGAALVPVVQALAPALLSVLSALMPLIPLLGGALGQILIALAPVVADLATVLGQVLTQAVVALVPLFMRLVPVLVEIAQQNLPLLIPLIDQLGRLLLNLMPLLIPLVKLIADIAVPMARWTNGTVVMLPALTMLVGMLATAVGWIAHFVGWLVRGADSAKTWKAVGDFFVRVWHDITGAFAAAVAFIRSVPDRIVSFFHSLPGRLAAAARAAFDAFFTAIGVGIGLILREWMELPTQIGNAVQAMWDWVVGQFNIGVNRVTAVATWLKDEVPRLLAELWTRGKALFSEGVDAIRRFLFSLPDTASSAMSSLGTTVVNALSNAGHWLYDAGRNLILGLIHGIEDMVGNAINAVQRAARDIYHGALRALGVESPSKLFAGIGQNTMLGLAHGILANADIATDAVRRALDFGGLAGNLGVPAFASGLGGAGYVPPRPPAPVFGGVPPTGGYAPIIVNLGGTQMAAVHAQLIPVAQRYRSRTGSTGLETPPV